MKRLLNMIAINTLFVTSVVSLKPVFTSSVSHGFKSQQPTKNISINGDNNTNPFISKIDFFKDKNVINVTTLSDGTVWIGTRITTGSGKLYKSTDGKTFTEVQGVSGEIKQVVMTPNGTIFVGVYTANDVGNLYKSTDGKTFTEVAGYEHEISALVVDNNGTIFVGTTNANYEGKLYKSTDEKTFTEISKTFGHFINTLAIAPDGTVWIGTRITTGSGKLYKSTDGKTFTEVQGVSGEIKQVVMTPNGTIFVGTNIGNPGLGNLYKSTDGKTFTEVAGLKSYIKLVVVSPTEVIWIGTNDGLYKSTDGINFSQVLEFHSDTIFCLAIAPDGTVWIGTLALYKFDLIDNLLNLENANYYNGFNNFIYNKKQKIDIKDKLVNTAILDNKNITIPTTNIELTNGEHSLILTLKDEYKSYIDLFGGNPTTGEITYNFWVKTSIDKKDIKYSTNHDDTDLTDLSLGFVSTSGNTINCPIIQTKSKDGSVHNAPLITKFDDVLIDYPNSYYIQGIVDESTNDFKATGSKQNLSLSTTIKIDGTYHLHLVDTVGNTYDSYLELGESNWKLKGTFNDEELNKLKTELNVTINLTDSQQLARANGWLNDYKKNVTDLFEKSLQVNGKGFVTEIKTDLASDFKWFLKPLTYLPKNEPKFDNGIDKDKLDKTIRDTAEKCLQDGLSGLPQGLNVNTSNVVNKSTLDSYTNWIREYNSFVNLTKDQWINDAVALASRGFASVEEVQKIKNHIESLKFSDYLKNITWTPTTSGYGTSNDFLQYVKLDKLNRDAIEWTIKNLPDINKTYESALKEAESGLNLHGYNINGLLNGKPLPKTKGEIDNFFNGTSFHNYLQTQANSKFHGWQLQMGLGIGLPLLLVIVGIGIIIRWRTDPRYNPLARARKDERADKRAVKKGQ